jgi:transcriptional regulator with GAF, ATPase, and Fis domain
MKETASQNLQALQQRLEDYERLHGILQTIGSSLRVDEILQRVIVEAMGLCRAEQGAIILFDPASNQAAKTLIRQAKAAAGKLDHFLNNLLAGWVSDHKTPLLTQNLSEAFGVKIIQPKYGEIASALSVPLEWRGAIIGVINLVAMAGGSIFGEREKNLMQLLASQCAQFIINARLHEELFAETARLRREVQEKHAFHGIIGHSPKMQAVFNLLEKIIPTDGRVLLEGESGTGKERIARALHYNGPRKDHPFIAVDCGAIPANLLESELFGYVKGAFTGATQDKKGLFEEANGGTLFLDEIANMPPEVQVKFLRVIQEGEFRPLGATQVRKVDVRIIAAASGSLRQQVNASKFRQDLFYRLNVVNVQLPPLRERKEDLVVLAGHFLAKMMERHRKSLKGFAPEVIADLEDYAWPGNVRELENVVERMVILAEPNSEYLARDLLPTEIQLAAVLDHQTGSSPTDSARRQRDEQAKKILLETLIKNNWNQSAMARDLGMHEKTIRYRMQKFGIKKA